MGDFFNPEKGIWSWLSTAVDIVGLSIAWLLLCLPLVTIGPATAALYHAVVLYVRPREQGAFKDFFLSFRKNLRVGVPATLVCLAAGAVLAWGYAIVRQNGREGAGVVMLGLYYTLLFVPAGVLCWLFPLLGRFVYGVGGLFRTALQLTVAHLPSTVVVVLLTAQTAVFCIEEWWPVVFMPAVATLLISLFFERIFQKHAPELAEPEDEADA